MQRFGKFHDTHLVGIAVLKGDFKTACDIIMRAKPREQERYKALRMKFPPEYGTKFERKNQFGFICLIYANSKTV